MPKQIIRHRDFIAGQVDIDAIRRDDSEIQRAGCRAMLNMRPLGTGPARQRPGRRALFRAEGRTETIRIGVSGQYRLNFLDDRIRIYSEDGALLASDTGYPWNDKIGFSKIRFVVAGNSVIVTYAGRRPRIVTRDEDGNWSFDNFDFDRDLAQRRLMPFYRYAERGITMRPDRRKGTAEVVFSEPVLTDAHVGVVFRYAENQMVLREKVTPTRGWFDIIDTLPKTLRLTVNSADGFAVGEVVAGDQSSAKGFIIEVDGNDIFVTLTSDYASGFQVNEKVIGPNATAKISAANDSQFRESTFWDEALMSDARGWPAGVSFGFNRLFFFDMQGATDAWSASRIEVPGDFNVGTEADEGFTELVPGRGRVLAVVPGPDIFVLTDRKSYYVPVSEANPLKPGSAAFREIGRDGCAEIQPIETSDGVVYVNAGLTRIMAIVGTGQTARPYILQDLTQYHTRVLNRPLCVAATTGDGTIPERYIYVVNQDGTMAVARVDVDRKIVGWQPWTGVGSVTWASADGTEVLLTTDYGGKNVVEAIDDTFFLDMGIAYNAAPVGLEPPPGDGPLWFAAGETVAIMRGLRDLGDRVVDPDGFLTPLLDDDFTGDDLIVGFPWECRVTPFVPVAGEGNSVRQGMRRRRVPRAAVTVVDSVTNFTFMGKFIGPYRWQDDQTQDPPRRTETHRFVSLGRDFDPEIPLVKTRPGPLTIAEITLEVSV
jgi:hypothetical protein